MPQPIPLTLPAEQRITDAPIFDALKALSDPQANTQALPMITSQTVAEILIREHASQSAYRPDILHRIMRTTLGKTWAPLGFDFLKREFEYFVQHPNTTFGMHYDAFLHLHFANIFCSETSIDGPFNLSLSKRKIRDYYFLFVSANIALIKSQTAEHQIDMSDRLVTAASHSFEIMRDIMRSNVDWDKPFRIPLLHAIGHVSHKALVSKFKKSELQLLASDDAYKIFAALEAPPPTCVNDSALLVIENTMSDFKDVRSENFIFSAIFAMDTMVTYAVSAHIVRAWPAESIALLSDKAKARILLDVIRFSGYSDSNFGTKFCLQSESEIFDGTKSVFFQYLDIPPGTDFLALISTVSSSLDFAVSQLLEWTKQSKPRVRSSWICMLDIVISVCHRLERTDLASSLEAAKSDINTETEVSSYSSD